LNASEICAWLAEGAIFSGQKGQAIIAWGDSRWESSPNSETSAWFYFPDYFLEAPKPWLNFAHSTIVPIEELTALLKELPGYDDSKLVWSEPYKRPFENGFHELQSEFHEGTLEKVVLYTTSTSKTPLNPMQLKRTLISILINAQTIPLYLYGFWYRTEGIVGATPELLFWLDYMSMPPQLKTMALAGTQKTDDNAVQMLSDAKLLKEHSIVVEDIERRLSSFGTVSKGELQLLKLPYLTHLYTPITLEILHLEPFSSFVKQLHPTPALGGFPREPAWKWLKNYNKIQPRGRFGAPVGFWDPTTNDSACYVAIRNVMWNERGAKIAAGCGIVAESTLENEWEEILLKTKSIKGFLQL
jgi:menaquinone-specific isochorismate synthase